MVRTEQLMVKVYNPFKDEYEEVQGQITLHFDHLILDGIEIDYLVTEQGVDLLDWLSMGAIDDLEQKLFEEMADEICM